MNYKTQLLYIENSTVLKNVTKDSVNFILYNISRETKYDFILHIVEDNFELELTKKELEFYDKNIEIIKFPEWNIIPYDVNSPSIKIQTERIEAIYKLLNYKSGKVVLLVSKNAMVQKVINRKDFKFINFAVGQKICVSEIRNILDNNCYNFKETAMEIGDFSVNNETVDLITFDNQAYRIILKNCVIQEIKSFNSNSQIGYDNHKSILVLPVREVIFTKENMQNFRQNYRRYFGIPASADAIYDTISKGVFYSGCENWLPLFYNNEMENLLNYIPENSLITYNASIKDKIANFLNFVNKYYGLRADELKRLENKNMYNPIFPELLYLSESELQKIEKNFVNIIFDVENVLKNVRQIELDFKNVPNFFIEKKEVFKDLKDYLLN